jgi:hypothetical protein
MNPRLPRAPDFPAMEVHAPETADQRTNVLAHIGNLVFTWSNNESMFLYLLQILMRCDFDTAAITFVSLNTTRARLDLVRRLAKSKVKEPEMVRRVERLIERFSECTKLRNEFNHCIYQLDDKGQITHTGVLRIVETKEAVQYASVRKLDADRLREINLTVRRLTKLNRDLWAILPDLEQTMRQPPPRGVK